MYVHLDENFIKKNRDEARKASISMIGKEEGKSDLLWEVTSDIFDSVEIEDDKIDISVTNELGTFQIDIPFDSAMLEQILTVTIKKMNKIKTMLESLK